MKRMVDIHDLGIDIIFRDNNYLAEFEWSSEDATLEQTTEKSIQAFSLLTQLWLPEYWMVEISPFVFGHPDSETQSFQITSDLSSSDFDKAAHSIQHLIEQHTNDEQSWSLKSIMTSHQGWNRLALPLGVTPSDSWGIVDPDGNIRNSYSWHPAPSFAQQETIWINIRDANAASYISVLVEMTGEIRIIASIGISFFNPKNDARSPNHLIQEATLNAWQQANISLLQAVIDQLEHQGWKHC